MKYMNMHFGQSQIFKRARFMAADPNVEGGEGGSGGGGASDSDPKTPSVEELMTELAQERAKGLRQKAALDDALKEKGELTKQLRAKMSAEEQEAEAKKEADEAKDARLQELEIKLRNMDYSKRFMGLGMDEKVAEEISGIIGEIPDTDKFFTTLGKFIEGIRTKAAEDTIEKIKKENPGINAGTGSVDKNAQAIEMARELAKKKTGQDTSIVDKYTRR